MAKLPPSKRIHLQEIQEAPTWIQRILITVNSFMQNVWEALNNGLTFQDNFDAKIVETSFTGGDTLVVQNPLNRPIVTILVAKITGGALTGGVTPVWQEIGQKVEITDITGLTAGQTYNVRLLFL